MAVQIFPLHPMEQTTDDNTSTEQLVATLFAEMGPCGICHEPLQASLTFDNVSRSPNCMCAYHTSCLVAEMKNLSRFVDHQCPNCSTGVLYSAESFFSEYGSTTSVSESLTALAETPAFKADLKALKKIMREANGALTTFKKLKKTVATNWKNEVKPLIQSLKEQKKGIMHTLITSEQNRNQKSKWAKFRTERNKLLEKYSISLRKLNLIAPEVHRGTRHIRFFSMRRGLWISI